MELESQSKILVEGKLLPFTLLLSMLCHVVAMYLPAWLHGYYGDVSVTQYSPWYLCNVNCLSCDGDNKPRTDCFWMDDWADSGYDIFGLAQYLEYWCLGGLLLALIPSSMVACGYFIKLSYCGIDIRRPALLFMFVAAVVSTISISLFSSKLSQPPDEISNFQQLTSSIGAPYVLRMFCTIVTWFNVIVAVSQECRKESSASADIDGYTVVTQSRTIEEVMEDECEEDGQLL